LLFFFNFFFSSCSCCCSFFWIRERNIQQYWQTTNYWALESDIGNFWLVELSKQMIWLEKKVGVMYLYPAGRKHWWCMVHPLINYPVGFV
jgi:hypothetical protein